MSSEAARKESITELAAMTKTGVSLLAEEFVMVGILLVATAVSAFELALEIIRSWAARWLVGEGSGNTEVSARHADVNDGPRRLPGVALED